MNEWLGEGNPTLHGDYSGSPNKNKNKKTTTTTISDISTAYYSDENGNVYEGQAVADYFNNKNKNKNTATPTTISLDGTAYTRNADGTIKSNDSYRGGYINFNPNVDYQAKINEAIANNDYTSAAAYEASRNAKLNYLNTLGFDTGGNATTYNYTKVDQNKNWNGGNSYDSIYTDFSSLPSGWKSANVNGIDYTTDGNLIFAGGSDKSQGSVVGSSRGVNPETGEMRYNSMDDAKRAAYDSYMGNIGVDRSSFGSTQAYYDYMDKNNIIGSDYISQVMEGTLTSNVMKQADETIKREKAAAAAAAAQAAKYEDDFHDEEYINLPTQSQEVLEDNSFETDYRYQEYYDYLEYMKNNERRRLMSMGRMR